MGSILKILPIIPVKPSAKAHKYKWFRGMVIANVQRVNIPNFEEKEFSSWQPIMKF
jgi:hypothetical protein